MSNQMETMIARTGAETSEYRIVKTDQVWSTIMQIAGYAVIVLPYILQALAAFQMQVSNKRPARPTKARPCSSSSAPGASPIR